jgi:hypothetical protein
VGSNVLQGKVTEGGEKNEGNRGRKFINIFNVRIMSMLVVQKTLLGCTLTTRIWRQRTIK